MTSQKKAGSRGDPEIYNIIESLIIVGKNLTPRQILTKLKGELPSSLEDSKLPSVKTVERIMKEHRISVDSEKWDWTSDSASDAKLVIEILPQIANLTEGEKVSFTASEAASILRVRKVAPDLDMPWVWYVSFMYRWYEEAKWPTHDLDMFLALAPWREEESWRMAAYEKMIGDAWISELGFVDVFMFTNTPSFTPYWPPKKIETSPPEPRLTT